MMKIIKECDSLIFSSLHPQLTKQFTVGNYVFSALVIISVINQQSVSICTSALHLIFHYFTLLHKNMVRVFI
jgi:hypothetical protein